MTFYLKWKRKSTLYSLPVWDSDGLCIVEGLAPFFGHPSARPPELEVADPVVDTGLGVVGNGLGVDGLGVDEEEEVPSSKVCESLSFWQSGLNLWEPSLLVLHNQSPHL